MQFEVENKYAIADPVAIESVFREFGADLGSPEAQCDLYFAHPSRDFAVTDEALRIRSIGADNYITYKGPKLDTETKTRREIELPLSAGAAAVRAYRQLLEALGFRTVAEVRKRRRTGRCDWRGHQISFTLDTVDQLGNYIELEILADATELPRAQSDLVALAELLGLPAPERRSYLEMLLALRT